MGKKSGMLFRSKNGLYCYVEKNFSKGKGIQELTLLFADRRNGSSGGWERRESYLNVFAFGYGGYRQVCLCGSVWLNE